MDQSIISNQSILLDTSENISSLQNKIKILTQNIKESDHAIESLQLLYNNEQKNHAVSLKKLKDLDKKNKKFEETILSLESNIHNLTEKINIIQFEKEQNDKQLREIKETKQKEENNKNKDTLLEPLLNKNNQKEKEHSNNLILEMLEKDNDTLNLKMNGLEKTIIELQNTLQNQKNVNNDLVLINQRLENDFLELLNNQTKQKELEKDEKEKQRNELSFEDELYILEKKNKINSLENEVTNLIEQKNELSFDLFELKGALGILEKERDDIKKQIKYLKQTEDFQNENKCFLKKFFCCFS